MTVKAIETRYAGCRFRSRLEARWAIFLDTLKIEWSYEPEGFETPHGRYLPDFWLPAHGRWLEIKGGSFTQRDRARGAHFAEVRWQLGEGYRVLQGDIPRRCINGPHDRGLLPALIWAQAAIPVPPTPGGIAFTPNRLPCGWTQLSTENVGPGQLLDWVAMRDFTASGWLLAATPEEVNTALTAARSARFEHGERG